VTLETYGGERTALHILESWLNWAVVGCSPDPARPSNGVAEFLVAKGYRVVPVNPAVDDCLGERCFPTLEDAARDAGPIEVVDIFRRSELAGVHVDEAIAIGAKAVWLQLGVIDEAAVKRARDAGLEVVMDRCPAIDYPRLLG
jgi:predicted CoA-binding protein